MRPLSQERGRIRGGSRQGRQRLRRKLGARSKTPQPGGAARRSRRSGLRQDRGASFTWAFGASAPGRGFEPPLVTKANHVTIVAMPKLEVRRQAKLHLVGSSGKRRAGSPDLAAAWLRPRVSQRSRHVKRAPRESVGARGAAPGCDRESGSPQGARDGSRLQKSVRRIFLVS